MRIKRQPSSPYVFPLRLMILIAAVFLAVILYLFSRSEWSKWLYLPIAALCLLMIVICLVQKRYAELAGTAIFLLVVSAAAVRTFLRGEARTVLGAAAIPAMGLFFIILEKLKSPREDGR